MFDWLIRLSLTFRMAVIGLYLALALLAVAVIPRMPIDVFPEFAPAQVQIQTEAPGFPAGDVETLVSRPIEAAMSGMPHVAQLRSYSSVGLSRVVVVFAPGIGVYDARMLAQERLQVARSRLPAGIGEPEMMPVTSAVSWLQKFALIDWSPQPDPLELRAMVDWDFRNALIARPGVAEVVASGGGVKQYQVMVDPLKLRLYGVSFADVVAAARAANLIEPGGFLHPSDDEEYFLRVDARVRSLDDLARTPVALRDGVPIVMADIAEIRFGEEIKRGDAAMLGGPAVVGTVSKLWGADTLSTTRQVEGVLEELGRSLPDHIQLVPNVFQQASSIERSISSLQRAMVEAVVIVALVLALFMGRWRPTVISLIAIPASLTVAMLILWAFGIGINALTLGGLIFAIGEVVDDAIIDVENIVRRARENARLDRPLPMLRIVFEGSSEIRNSVVFATLIVVVAFIPMFALSDLEGRIFAPMALAYLAAVVGSLFVALSLIPVLTYFALSGREARREDHGLSRAATWLQARYRAGLAPLMGRAPLMLAISVAGALAAALLLGGMDRAFLPRQSEGNVVIATTMMPGTSLQENMRMGREVERIVAAVPGVVSVAQRAGRSRLDEDAQPVNFSEFDVTLDPALRDAAGVIEAIREALAVVPGVAINVSQFITHRMQEILSGVQAQVVVKVFGSDLGELSRIQQQVIAAVEPVAGTVDLMGEPVITIPGYDIRVVRDAAALHGLTPADVARQAGQALNGVPVASVQEGDRAFDLLVRADEAARADIATVGDLPIASATGAIVPLSEVASIAPTTDSYQVTRENGMRRAVVRWNVAGADLNGNVELARRNVLEQVTLPPGYSVEFGGDYQAQQRASAGLLWSGSLSFLVICTLLQTAFRSGGMTLMVLANIPFALLGGAIALRLGGETLNVASLVGLIALAGISVRNGILLMSRYGAAVADNARHAATEGAVDRLLPVVMTALTTSLAVIPLLIGDPVGKEFQRAFALVILGGMASSMLMNMFIIPPLYAGLRARAPAFFGAPAADAIATPR